MPINAVEPGEPDASTAADEWLARITEVLLRDGLVDVSMRRLAAIAGTSHQLLGYHYGSRDGVLSAVLRSLREQESATIIGAAASRREAYEGLWRHFTSEQRRVEMRLFFQIAGNAVSGLGGERAFLDTVVSTWGDALAELGIRDGLTTDAAQVEARAMLSSMRGLLLDVLLTDDAPATDAAFALLLDRVLA